MRNLTFRICELFCDGFLCTLQLPVFIKIFLGILRRCQCRIKRNSDLLVGIIVQCLKRSAAFLKPVSVGVDQFTVNLEFIFFGSIIQLFFLDVIFFTVTFQSSLYYTPKIGRFLVDACQQTLGCIISFQHGGNAVKSFTVVFTAKLLIWKNSIFNRFLTAVNNVRCKLSALHLFHQPEECMIKMGTCSFIQRLCCITSVNGSTVADLLSHYRAHTCKRRVESLGNVLRFFADMLRKFLLGNSEWVLFIPGIGNEIFSSGKNLTDRAHMGRDMLDAVQDHSLFVTENDVAVLAHQFHDQVLSAGITQLIKMLKLKLHHTFHSRLLYI